ncbi:MAG: glycoside hydrolase family 127 protein, partial [Planctomycetes bacterium]|nr:glycoside hydrolase family 127 protein [Planctomycetota bacterium]
MNQSKQKRFQFYPFFMLAILFAIIAIGSSARAEVSKDGDLNFTSAVDMVFKPFELNQVQLLDGRIKEEMEINRKYLHEGAPKELGDIQFDSETVLYLFRNVAGLPSPGHAMGHTDQPNSGRAQGQYSGHVLSGLAMMYASSGDQELRQRSEEILAGLAEVQESYGDGYLSAWPKSEWDKLEDMDNYCYDVPYYCQHKLMAGLWDQYRVAGSKQALEMLKKSADWFALRYKKQSPELIDYVQHKFENGGMIEMYLNLYGYTGNKDYLTAALAMQKPDWFDQLAKKDDGAIRIHGNVHTPLIVGLARHYELTGDQRSRDIAEFFWNQVVNTRSFATGGSTVYEGFGLANDLSKALCENTVESCVVYNMLKLTRHLYAWTGDPKFGDFYERAYFNHIIGSIGSHGGIKTYSQALGHGSRKKDHGATSCCYGTAMESFSKLGDSIYFRSDNNLYVNLYIASVLNWNGKGIKVTQNTVFPESDTMKFEIEAAKPTEFAMNFRVPYWATNGIKAKVNGKAVKTNNVKPTSWFVIDRKWKSGDTVELVIPMSLHYQAMADDPGMVAIMYGPLVLAGELDGVDFFKPELGGTGAFVLKDRLMDELVPAKYYFTGLLSKLDKWIKPLKGDPLKFKTVGQSNNVVLRPYNEFRPHARSSYIDLIDAQGLDLSYKADKKSGSDSVIKELPEKYNSMKHFEVYWVMAKDGDEPNIKRIRDEQAKLLANKARMIDIVMPRHSTESVAYRNRQASEGIRYGWNLIHASDKVWFSWDLKITSDKPVNLLVQYTSRLFRPASTLMSGNDFWNSSFDILVDGKVIATKKPYKE